ncbi:MAG: sodium:solute symporter family protein [Planctomycetota bacterium]
MVDHLPDLLAIGVLYVLILIVGIRAGRKEREDGSAEGMLLARRGMPLFISVFTMVATWVGGGYINGTAEEVYNRGIVWTQAPWGYSLSLILGGLFFAVPLRRRGCTTMLDPFEHRYGKRMAAVLFLPALVGEIFWSAAILAALGTTFGTILNFDFTTAILISAVFAIAYTVVGGLWSVAYTDTVQLIFILVGLAVTVPFAVSRGGGLGEIWNQYADRFGSAARLMPPMSAFRGGDGWGNTIWQWIDVAGLLVFGGIAWQSYFQRVLAMRYHRTAVGMSVLAGFGCMAIAFPAGLVGVVGAVADWEKAGVEPPAPALVLPYVLKYLTPPVVATFGLATIAAAVMSSVDSSILSASSMFVWNVYRPLIRPAARDAEIRRAVQVSVVLVGGLATLLAVTAESVYALWFLCSDLVYAILFPQLVMVLFSKRANWIGAAVGAAVGLFLRLGGGEPFLGIPPFLPYPMRDPELGIQFPFRTFAMLSGLATIYLVSRLTSRHAPPVHRHYVLAGGGA